MTTKAIVTQINIYRVGENPIFGESAVKLAIEDDGAGPYFSISQTNRDSLEANEVRLELGEFSELYNEACKLLTQYESAMMSDNQNE